MKTKTIVIYIDVMERYHFFKKFFEPILYCGYDVCIITGRLSIALRCKKQRIKAVLLKEISIKKNVTISLENSLSVLNEYHTLDEALLIYSSTQSQLVSLQNEILMYSLFIWNGSTTMAKAIGDFASQNKIKTFYFEISNLGSKVFVDKEGVNAKSYLYKHPEILDTVEIPDTVFYRWREEWNKDFDVPKQSKNVTKIPFSFMIDLFGFYLLHGLREDRRSFIHVLKKKFLLKKSLHSIIYSKNLPDEFYFLAMQVSDDSQLIINSNVDNVGALEKAKELAAKEDIFLVVKLHPAESNLSFIKEMEKRAASREFILVNKPTKELISKAKKVIVINSTVGLEAMIYEKKVIVLGNALYKKFDFHRLKSYILDYLIDIDYFDKKESISTDILKKILDNDAK